MKKLMITVLAFLSINAFAGDAGCGLGSVVIQRNSKLLQLFAMTTNGTFFSQAFGITSGTSGCSASGIVYNDKQIEYFVEVNKEDLSREMAQGEGEKLHVLAQLHGCVNLEAQEAFAVMTQKSFDKIIPAVETQAPEMVENLKKELSDDAQLAQMCHVAGI